MADLIAKVSADTSEFRSDVGALPGVVKKSFGEMKTASEGGISDNMKDLKKGFNDLKDLIVGGGLLEAVNRFFTLAIDTANKSKDATDQSAAAVRRFGEGIQSAKDTVAQFAVIAVGTFNKLGEAMGNAIKIVRDGWDDWAKGEDALKETGKAADEAAESLAKSNKHAAEFKQITSAIAEIEKQKAALSLQGITKQETLNNLTNEYLRLGVLIANGGQSAIDRRKTELEFAQAGLAMNKAQLEVNKESAAKAEAAAKESERALANETKQFEALVAVKQKEADYQRSKMTAEEQLAALTKEKISLEKQLLDENISITEETEARTALLEVQKQLDTTSVEAAAEKLKREKEIAAELEAQNAISKKALELVQARVSVEETSRGNTIQSQSTAALEGVRDRITGKLYEAQAANFGQFGGVGGGGTDPAIAQFKNDIAKIEKELAQRKEVQQYAQRFGEVAAVRQYGDELSRRALQDLNSTSTRTANALDDISRRLAASGLFPKL